MSTLDGAHRRLCEVAARWVRNKGYGVVLVEFVSYANELPDVIGFRGNHSVMVEIKVSRSDFLADRKKSFRYYEENGMGDHRYYCVPKGLIKEDELPDGWGLIEVNAKGAARRTVWALNKQHNYKSERELLYSFARRAVVKGLLPEIIKPILPRGLA